MLLSDNLTDCDLAINYFLLCRFELETVMHLVVMKFCGLVPRRLCIVRVRLQESTGEFS